MKHFRFNSFVTYFKDPTLEEGVETDHTIPNPKDFNDMHSYKF